MIRVRIDLRGRSVSGKLKREKLGKEPDETVDWEAAAEFFKDLL
jgi:hypothetical protein